MPPESDQFPQKECEQEDFQRRHFSAANHLNRRANDLRNELSHGNLRALSHCRSCAAGRG